MFFVSNPEKLAAWKEGRTGFPYIDAIMTQLKEKTALNNYTSHK
jgi:deoxyribodipyrimidine photolyase